MGSQVNKIRGKRGNSDANTDYMTENQDSNNDQRKNNWYSSQPNRQMKLDETVKNIKQIHLSIEIDQCQSEETFSEFFLCESSLQKNLTPFQNSKQVFQTYTDLKSVIEYNNAISNNQLCILEKESDEESDISSNFPVINEDKFQNSDYLNFEWSSFQNYSAFNKCYDTVNNNKQSFT